MKIILKLDPYLNLLIEKNPRIIVIVHIKADMNTLNINMLKPIGLLMKPNSNLKMPKNGLVLLLEISKISPVLMI